MASDAATNIDKSVAMASAAAPTMVPDANTTDNLQEVQKGFLKLPEELVSNIACKLGSDDLFALRLTCRDLENKSLHEFATEYFGSKCFMFTTESLKVFVNIAKSEKLRHYFQKAYIITASATERQVQCCHRGGCAWNPTVREHEAFIEYKNDQRQLQDKGGDLKLLSEAFSHLPRLERLTLVDQPRQLPRSVKCYGLRKFTRTTGIPASYRPVDASFADEYYPWLTHVFRTMILAVTKSGISTLTDLHTHLNLDQPYGLSPTTDLQFKSTTLDQLTKAFSNLTTVDLCLRSRSLRVGKTDSQEELKVAARSVKSFARVLKNVTCLTLAADVGQWSGQILKSLASNIDLGKLTKFQLDGFLVDMETLAAIVCQLKSAHMITFMLVEICHGSWVPLLKALEKLPSLDHLHMYYLQAHGQKCFFLEKPDEDEDLTEPSWLDPLTGDILGAGGDEGEDDSGWSDADDDEDEDEKGEEGDEKEEDEEEEEEGEEEEEEEDEDDDDDDDGESLPDLLDPAGSSLPQEAPEEAVDSTMPRPKAKKPVKKAAQASSTQGTKSPSGCLARTDKHHRAPGVKSGERGYYICVEGEEIREQLPTFAKEYNLGGGPMGDLDFNGLVGNLAQFPAGAGGVGGMFAMPVPMPAPPGTGAGAQAAPAAGPNMPPLPALGGIFSLFGGPLPQEPPAQNPPGPGFPLGPTAANPGQAAPTTTASNANAPNTQDDHEEGWWEDGEVAEGGALDDVD
ncbi:hypothetical protein M409DRAFT_18162 [Zasmidium cellare ATCC 36951]|uniref:F-box domain-containing protein n=1 Tax=Zasmidium cellare ATCC 36951 TaxID=1080233 RepID=A0A6A6CXT8_ZASCE|nr:uncharacterized protein M409DRAFT_18162 [Zasmidium cellare ATCC 36951]KAF2171931.1 hypothetical protein M409DRAFT_18162 [Zasmidium cellare ATCC 36951]